MLGDLLWHPQLEEWQLIMQHYCIGLAAVCSPAEATMRELFAALGDDMSTLPPNAPAAPPLSVAAKLPLVD